MAVEAEFGRSFSRKVKALKLSRRIRRPPLLAHLVGFALTILIPSLVVGAFLILQFSRQQEMLAGAQVNDTAEMISNSIDRDIYGMMTAARVLGASPSIGNGELDAFRTRTTAALHATDMDALLIDRGARVIVSTRGPIAVPVPSPIGSDTVAQVFATRQPRVSNAYRDPASGTLHLAVAIPLVQGNEVRYVLAVTKEAERLGDVIADRNLPRAWSTVVSDRTGNRVFAAVSTGTGTDASTKLQSKMPSTADPTRNEAGDELIESSTVSSLTGWSTTVAVPSSFIGQPVMRSWRVLLGASAVQLIFSVGLGIWFGRRIAVPMLGLAKQAEAIGRGEPTTTIATEVEEIGKVSKVLAQASRARLEAEEQNRFLMREMTHRAKNQYALIGAIARRAAKDSKDTNQFLATLSEALASLARSSDLLAAKGWESATLGDLVESQLQAFGAGNRQIRAEGPAIQLNPTAAQTIGLALHELATNAAKYGALSCETGTVTIAWSLGTDFSISWREAGGPLVSEPKRAGFGTLVTQKMTARGLGGDVEMHYHPAGVHWRLSAPIATIAAH